MRPDRTRTAAPLLPDYTFERWLGAGGFGAVFLARRGDATPVAIKLAHASDRDAERRLEAEAQALRSIGPPTVPALYEAGETATGEPYLVMEYLTMPTLAECLRGSPMALPDF